jgi:hypothetical protein
MHMDRQRARSKASSMHRFNARTTLKKGRREYLVGICKEEIERNHQSNPGHGLTFRPCVHFHVDVARSPLSKQVDIKV